MIKKPFVIGFRTTPEMKLALDNIAAHDRRKVSEWITLVLEQVLFQRGALTKPQPSRPLVPVKKQP